MSAEGGQAPWPWSELGLDGPADGGAVRRAYAARLKAIDREDPAPFQRLRAALEAARRMATDAGASDTRPKMTQIARGMTPVDAPAPAPGPRPATPVPPAAPAAAAPDTGTDDPRRFLDDLARELTPRVWDVPRIEALLASAPAQDPHLRREAERTVFRALSDRYQSSDPQNIGPRTARLLEAEFAWHSDGVGFLRRFGLGGAAGPIIDDLQRLLSTAPHHVPSDGAGRGTLASLAGAIALIWAAWMLRSGDPDSPESTLMLLMASVALFLPVWVATAALVHVAGLTPIPPAVPRGWNRLCARWRPAGAVDLFLSRPGGRDTALRALATLICIGLVWWADL